MNINRLDDVDRALTRAHAWQLFPLLGGPTAAGAKLPFDLRTLVGEYVGQGTSAEIDELMKSEIGLVSTSWAQLGGAVWLVRVADVATADRWFPRERRVSDASDPSQFFTNTGVAVCVKEDVAAMSRRLGGDSLARQVVDLMKGRAAASLQELPIFQELTGHLPAKPLAMAYWTGGGGSQAPTGRGVQGGIEHAVLGMYEGDGRIDVALRAVVSTRQASRRLSDLAINRMLRLPQTTLAAVVTTIDFSSAFELAAQSPYTGRLGRYLALGAAFRSPNDLGTVVPFSSAGPHAILAWGQDLSLDGSTPQLAALVECGDPDPIADEVQDFMDRAIQLLRSLDPASSAGLSWTAEESSRLGTRIVSLPLGEFARRSRLPFMRLLEHMEPSWAIAGNWLIVALTREHVERIIDAQYDLVPTLQTVPDVYRLGPAPAERTLLAVGQPGLIAGVLSRWLKGYESGEASLLDSSWWSKPAPPDKRRQGQLGVGMRAEQEPGVVVVARIYAGSAADGGLQVGDRIIGVDGQLLNLESPNADLRRRIAQSTAPDGPVLRVLRSGAASEFVLHRPRDAKPAAATAPSIPLADVVRELSALARSLDFASFTVLASDEMRYSARLSVRFAPIALP